MLFHQQIRSGGLNLVLGNSTNVNLFTYVGSPVAPVDATVVIPAGITIGSTDPGTPAFDIGQFALGSIIVIEHSSAIQGAGGTANGGAGGTAIKADYLNQIVIINAKAGSTIYGGGGGGGKGGTGGKGGAGGGGYYTTTEWRYSRPSNYWEYDTGTSTTKAYWDGVLQGVVAGNRETTIGAFSKGGERGYETYVSSDGKATFNRYFYDIGFTYNVFTSGGIGGNGGVGGNGGRGHGYAVASAAGAAGSPGAAGAAGGTNAGAGGKGGTGGTGGTGGGWGAAGGTGNTGVTGNAGAAGNNGTGSAGSAGNAGSTGGAAGRYLIKGAANVTLNNAGTVAGVLA